MESGAPMFTSSSPLLRFSSAAASSLFVSACVDIPRSRLDEGKLPQGLMIKPGASCVERRCFESTTKFLCILFLWAFQSTWAPDCGLGRLFLRSFRMQLPADARSGRPARDVCDLALVLVYLAITIAIGRFPSRELRCFP